MIRTSCLPPLHLAHVLIDFDGTLTVRDVLDELVRGYAVNQSWESAEQEWRDGLIGSKQCLERQLDLVHISDAELGRFLDRVELDHGAADLLTYLTERSVPVTVVSDGLDLIIARTLASHGIVDIDVRCNLAVRSGPRIGLDCPHASSTCKVGAAHCKCSSASAVVAPGRKIIYIGDGRSDLCPARSADFVFAKKALADLLDHERITFSRYQHLSDVRQAFDAAWGPRPELSVSAGRGGE